MRRARRLVEGAGRKSDRGSERVGGGEAAHRFARALGIQREGAERVERRRDPRLQVVPRLTVQRRVQQVFGSSRLAACLGDERALVLDQRDQPVVVVRHDEGGGLVERGLRGVEVACHPPRRAEHPEELSRPQGHAVFANHFDERLDVLARGGDVAGRERDVRSKRDRFTERRTRRPPRWPGR